MLKVFYGNDTALVRMRAHEQVGSGTPVIIDTDTYQAGMIAEAVESVSLFGGVSSYVLDTPSADEAFASEIFDNLASIAASPHLFVVIEGTLLAAQKKQYAQHALTIEEFKRESGATFNVFALADALCRKDKKTLWLLLNDGYRAGLSGEEIAGTLWWQLKTLRLAAVTASADEAGMKSFPYNKAKRALGAFQDGELVRLSQSLLACYHDARLGKLELELALERWVLSL